MNTNIWTGINNPTKDDVKEVVKDDVKEVVKDDVKEVVKEVVKEETNGVSKVVDYMVILKVKNANPNGDPVNDNMPRHDMDGIGEISDVCLKRKIRDRFLENNNNILIRPNDELKSIKNRLSVDVDLSADTDTDTIIKKTCATWIDVRAFGALLAFKGKDKGRGVSIGIKGCVSVGTAFSVEPINITTTTIVKSVNGEGDGDTKTSDTMGRKHRVDEAVYVFSGTINPLMSRKTGFNDDDVKEFKKVLPKLFENDASSARPEGTMSVLSVLWWEHKSDTRDISAGRIIENVEVAPDGSYTFIKDIGVKCEELPRF